MRPNFRTHTYLKAERISYKYWMTRTCIHPEKCVFLLVFFLQYIIHISQILRLLRENSQAQHRCITLLSEKLMEFCKILALTKGQPDAGSSRQRFRPGAVMRGSRISRGAGRSCAAIRFSAGAKRSVPLNPLAFLYFCHLFCP